MPSALPTAGRGRSVPYGAAVWAVLFVTVIALLAGSAPGAPADELQGACGARDMRTVFAPWLDPANYFVASNGNFETGAAAWDLAGGAAIGTGNEPFFVGDPGDGHSLVLPAGATATSASGCVQLGEPTIRLFVKVPAVVGSHLTIRASVENPTTGISVDTSYTVVSAMQAGWMPTPEIALGNFGANVLPEDLTVSIRSTGTPATWAVDDLYVDPYKSR